MSNRQRPFFTAPSPAELARVEGRPLSAWRLADIWQSLPEVERLPFILALDEAVSEEVIELTCKRASGAQRP